MKKTVFAIFLIISFLIGTVTGGVAVAGQQVKIFVNGLELAADPAPLIHEGRTFVPLRLMSEGLGANVTWDPVNWAVNVDTKPRRPAVIGDAEFRQKVNGALDLLEEKAYPHYYLACSVGWPIEWKQRLEYVSDYPGNATIEKGKIIILEKLTADSSRYNPEYLAGIIAHESIHALVLKLDNEDIIYHPRSGENLASENELTVFRLIGAPQWMADEALTWESRYDFKNLK